MSSVSSAAADTSQRWQALKESRANQTADSGSASRTRAPRGQPPSASDPSTTGSVDASGDSTATSSISSASAKVISDLKALFIDLQSGASATAGATTGTSSGTSSTATAAATSSTATAAGTTSTATATGTSGSASVQSDLKTLAADLGKVGGHHGGHHSHHAAPTDASSTDTTTDAATSATSTAGQPASKPAGSVLDQLVGALKAYAASASDNLAQATTAGLSA